MQIFLFADPRMFIMKNMDMTPMSQNMKNTNRFAEVNRPTEAIWKRAIRAPDSLLCSFSVFPESAAAKSTTDDIISKIIDMRFILKPKYIPKELMYGYCSDIDMLPDNIEDTNIESVMSMFIRVDPMIIFLGLLPLSRTVSTSAIIGTNYHYKYQWHHGRSQYKKCYYYYQSDYKCCYVDAGDFHSPAF